MTLMDESVSHSVHNKHSVADPQGEIRATGFNEQVDSFYEMLQEGKVSANDPAFVDGG